MSVVIQKGKWFFIADRDLNCGISGWKNGDDITGDGHPDVIVGSFTGGAHCCFSWQIYSLANQPQLIANFDTLHSGGCPLRDFDGDGIAEFAYTDWTFAYWKTSFVHSPSFTVVLRFQNNQYVFAPDLMKKVAPSEADLRRIAAASRFDEQPVMWLPMLDLVASGNARSIPAYLDYAWPKERSGRAEFVEEFWGKLRTSPYWADLDRLNGGAR